jgi:hypothetical protein
LIRLDLTQSPAPDLTDSVLVALYRAERCFLIGIESERMIERLYELWRVEYLLRVESDKQARIYKDKFTRADQERTDEQLIGLDYAKQLGREQKRKKAWRVLATWGIPIGFVGGVLVGVR